MTVYIELGDFCEIAAEILGTTPEQIIRLPRIALADSALAAPGSGFGDQDAYPELLEKAAVLIDTWPETIRSPTATSAPHFSRSGSSWK